MNDDYLTLVFQQPLSDAARSLLESGDWSAASHSHAIQDRDRLSALCDKWNFECDEMREDNKRLEKLAHAIEGTKPPDCSTCANRGHVADQSQEMICDYCVWQERWRIDHYRKKSEAA